MQLLINIIGYTLIGLICAVTIFWGGYFYWTSDFRAKRQHQRWLKQHGL